MNIDYSKSTTYTKRCVQRPVDNHENETWWQRRSGMERKLFISLLVAVCVVIGCIVFIVLKYLSTKEYCNSPVCLTAGSEIMSYINPDIDPCEDFARFVCGTVTGNVENKEMQINEDVQQQLAELIQEPIRNDDHYLVKRQKKLFEACMNETGIEESIEMLNQTIKEMTGWPTVVGYRWKARLFEWMDAVYVLREKGYPFSMLLWVSLATDRNNSKYSAKISHPIVKAIKEEHKELYKEFMTDVAVIFGADRYQTKIQMTDVLEFMEDLANITFLNYEENVSNNDDIFGTKVTVDEIQRIYIEINWLEFINNILYPARNISGDDYIFFPTYEYMDAYFELLSKTTKRVQANYIIWRVLEDMMPYMSKELQYLQTNYSCQTQQFINQDRIQFCAQVASENFFIKTLNLAYARKNLVVKTKTEIEELFWNIKFEFMDMITKNSWIDDESKENSINFLDVMNEIIGAPNNNYLNDTLIELLDNSEIEDDTADSDNFFKMLLDTRKAHTFISFYLINQPYNTSRLFHELVETKPVYSQSHNTIILPVTLFQDTFYNSEKPMYLNYAGIGTLIGYVLTKGFCQNLETIWAEKIISSFKNRTQCIINVDQDSNFEKLSDDDSLSVEDTIAYITGINTAYGAYQIWAKETDAELQLSGIDYTPNQLFWISTMSLQCFKLNQDNIFANYSRSRQISHALRKNADFSNDFNCPLDSDTNSLEECKLF